MDILFVRNLFRPADFGGNRYPWEVTRRLVERGHRVRVVTPRPAGPLPGPTPVEFRHYPVSRRTPFETFFTNAIFSQLAVRTELARAQPDVIVFSSYDVAFGHYATRTGSSGPPSVYIYHSSFYSDAVDRVAAKRWPVRLMHGPLGRFLRGVERLAFRRATRIVAVSPFSREEIELRLSGPDERIWTIPTGIDAELFTPGDQASARTAFGLAPDARVLLTVGRLSKVKRYDRAIDTLAILRSEDPRYVLVVAGTGPEREALAARAFPLGSAVRFTGFVDGEPLRDLYRAADICLCTSEFENWSLTILESLAAGTPVLGTPRGSIPDMLKLVDRSLILDGTSPEEIAAGVRKHLTRPDLDRLRRRASDLVRERFTWDRVAAELERCLTSAVTQNPPAK